MQFQMDVTGNPATIRAQFKQKADAARRESPQFASVVGAVQDIMGQQLAGLGPDAALSVKIDITMSGGSDTPVAMIRTDPLGAPLNETQRAQAAAHAETIAVGAVPAVIDPASPPALTVTNPVVDPAARLTTTPAEAGAGTPLVQSRTSTPKDGTK